MSEAIMLKALITAVLSVFAASAAAQPPPSGPPPTGSSLADCKPDRSNAPCKGELGVFVITNTIRNIAQGAVDEANATLKAKGKSSRVSIESLQQWRPSRAPTVYPNKPNSFFVHVPYILTIKVDIPVTSDRHIGIPIDADFFCENWQTPSRKVVVHARQGPASFEGGNIVEDVFNVGDYIDSQVRKSFPASAAMAVDIPNSNCAAIGGSDQGTQTTNDDVVNWAVPRHFRLPPSALRPTIEITFDRLKRLPARSTGGGILYRNVENITLNLYANIDGRQKVMTMREGEDLPLDLPPIRLNAGGFDQLVIIGNVDQPPDNPKDSGFSVFPKSANFGSGAHILQIPKWYSRPPDKITHKPTWVSVPAYELTYTVHYQNSGEMAVNGGRSSAAPPKIKLPLGNAIIKKHKP